MIEKAILAFEDRKASQEFINKVESGIYTGVNTAGEKVYVFVDQGEGMDVKTKCHEKEKFMEVVEYDAEGYQVSVSYEAAYKD